MSGMLGTTKVTQVGFIVKDVNETKKKWAEFLGLEEPELIDIGDYAVTQTKYKGEPAPNALCKMAFFEVGDGVQLELIEPNETPSTWRDFLNEHGEGIHHVAFLINNTKEVVMNCEGFG
ncbi:MAG: VOC family protein, partial [Eubacteriales bacterium]